jgi:hypothetical protein
MAPEQYIAMSTARGFIATGADGCCALFEAHERVDFFKILPLPFAGTMFILCRRRCVDSEQAVSETGCRDDSAAVIFKMQEGETP